MTRRRPRLCLQIGEASAPVILALVALLLVGLMAVGALMFVKRSIAAREREEAARFEADRRHDLEMKRQYEALQAAQAQSAALGTSGGSGVSPTPGQGNPGCFPDRPMHAPGTAESRVAAVVGEYLREHAPPSTPGRMLPGQPPSVRTLVPEGTQLLTVTIRGTAVTLDFSTELLARRNDPEFFDHLQSDLIHRLDAVEHSLSEHHFRIADADGTMRDLSYYLDIPPEQRPRQEPPQPVDGGK